MARAVGSSSLLINVALITPIIPAARRFEHFYAFCSSFGEIARLDIASIAVTNVIEVTFFKLSSAVQVQQLLPNTDFAPLADHDVRTVSIPISTVVSLPAYTAGGLKCLQSFGDIVWQTSNDTEVKVEFDDMRDAHRALAVLLGSLPVKSLQLQALVKTGRTSHSNHITAMRSPASSSMSTSSPTSPPRNSLFAVESPVSLASVTSSTKERHLDATKKLPPAFTSPKSEAAVLSLADIVQPSTAKPTPTTKAASISKQSPSGKSPTSASQQGKGASSPSTATPKDSRFGKIKEEDVSKYEINPQEIESGKDMRTTVMLRNIPKHCTHEAFLDMIESCGLAEQYTFLYMPFDKRRNLHCGFAFVDFQSPLDVLALFSAMQLDAWRPLVESAMATMAIIAAADNTQVISLAPPAASYARLQGLAELEKHFGSSNVMQSADSTRRPLFIRRVPANASAASSETASGR